jgi:transposase
MLRRSGDRLEAGQRDAVTLARFLRSGDLVAVAIPDEGVEALRDLVRARADAKQPETVARHHLGKLLPRKDRIYKGRSAASASASRSVRSRGVAGSASTRMPPGAASPEAPSQPDSTRA